MASTTEPKKQRPSIRALGADISNDADRQRPAATKKAETNPGASDKQPADVYVEEDMEGMVPGRIPANVQPLASANPKGVVPRYRASLDELMAARGEQRTARMSFKQLGDEGSAEMAMLLQTGTCKNLTGLDLSCNSIGVDGCKAIANALCSNMTIVNLDISANAIGDQGATALSSALAFNGTLKNLDLHACSIGDEGAKALASVIIDGNITVQGLNLKANYIQDEGAAKLAEAVKKSRSLKFLITQSNDITREGQRVLDRAFEENLNCSSSAVPGEHDNIVGEVCSIM